MFLAFLSQAVSSAGSYWELLLLRSQKVGHDWVTDTILHYYLDATSLNKWLRTQNELNKSVCDPAIVEKCKEDPSMQKILYQVSPMSENPYEESALWT